MDSNIVLPPSIDDVPPPGLALVEELDHTLMVQLRDGRKILGTLRSFDQFANLALEGMVNVCTCICVCVCVCDWVSE